MAHNRVTSLEECEHHKPTSGGPHQNEEDRAHDSLEGNQPSDCSNPHSLSALPPSAATEHSVGERLSFNLAAGPSWNQREADGEWSFIEEERIPSTVDSSDVDDESVRVFSGPIPRPDAAFLEPAAGFGHATGAFEVGKWKRIGKFCSVGFMCTNSFGNLWGHQ